MGNRHGRLFGNDAGRRDAPGPKSAITPRRFSMMISDKLPSKPNDTIFLEETSITHIENRYLATPCSVRVTLHLSPRIMCRIDSDSLPIWLVNINGPFSVTLKNGHKIKAFLHYNLNDFFYSASRETFKGFLVPYKSPCTVVQPDTQIQSVHFSVLNFPTFYGQNDQLVDLGGTSHRLGVAKMTYDDWRIEITKVSPSLEDRKPLNRDNNYSVTHSGFFKRFNSETFCVEEANNILRGLRSFLSFARGYACGLTLVKAIDHAGKEIILEWGATYTESWNQGSDTWLPTVDGGDSLSEVFPGFWSLYIDSDWKDTISAVIDWYLNSKNSPFHVGIILTQTALEALCYKIAGPKGKESTGKYLSEAIHKFGLCTAIPSSCRNLNELSKKNFDPSGDGPRAITEIRNDLVHSRKKYSHISAEAQMDALRLGQWYIALFLLKKLNYKGRYRNLLRTADEDPFENVPWAGEDFDPRC